MQLVIPLKALTRYDLKGPLTKWLDETVPLSASGDSSLSPMEYTSLKPNFHSVDCQKELTRLASLRNCLSDAITKAESHKHALDDCALQDCHEYHAALLAFERKGFPTGDNDSNLELTWAAAIPPQKEKHGSLVWDRVCTLWNIAALESFLGAHQDTDKEGRKQAVKHYQNSSACLRYLQLALDGQSFETVDMRKSLLCFWENAMLAQAQIAAYDMAATAPDKHALLSYLAMGAVPVLNEALTNAKDPFVSSSLHKHIQEWGSECKAQSMLLTARAEFHQAVVCRESRNWGLEIARLDKAQSLLKECLSFLKSSSMDSSMAETLMRRVQDRMVQAVKDNVTYGEKVTKELPEIPAKLLVKNDMEMPETMTNPRVALFDTL